MIKFENQENGRFYYLRVEKDMTGEDVLVVVRGGRSVCVTRTYGFVDSQARDKRIKALMRRRIRNGYSLVT